MFLGRIQRHFIDRRSMLLAGLALLLLLAPTAEAERLPVRTYTVADGLLRDTVYKIKQDSRGFLWFCTAEGISRFDGYAFTNFTTDDGLPSRYVNDFLETRDGTIYLATGGGLARLNPTGIPAAHFETSNQANPLFTAFRPDNSRAKEINVLFEDQSGTVWAGTSGEQVAYGSISVIRRARRCWTPGGREGIHDDDATPHI